MQQETIQPQSEKILVTREQILAAISKLTPEEIRAAGTVRINSALQHIEAAQNHMASACAELSTLVGAITVWKASSSFHDRIKAFWYRVNNLRNVGKYRLDDFHIEIMARKKAGLPKY